MSSLPPLSLPAGELRPPRLVLIGGGARSGKSAFALSHGESLGERRCFIATAQAFDDEMRARIDRHRADRGAAWQTLEEPLALGAALAKAPRDAVVVVDCLTLWLSNLLCADVPLADIEQAIGDLVERAAAREAPTLVVTNEVGLGLVPETPLGRAFRDLAGGAHQRLAARADEIYVAIMGVVLRLAPGPIAAVRGGGCNAAGMGA